MHAEEILETDGSETVIEFLETTVPSSDVPNIESELRKDFVLEKRNTKIHTRLKNKKKTHSLNRIEKKALGFFELNRDSLKYSDALPLNHVWTGYMSEILELNKPLPDCTTTGWQNFTQTIYKSDFHGSILQVIRSKSLGFVGQKGICIMDTKNTFKLVTRDNVVITIPKRDCVFELYLKNMSITLFGKHLCVKPAERSTKKVKGHQVPDLQ